MDTTSGTYQLLPEPGGQFLSEDFPAEAAVQGVVCLDQPLLRVVVDELRDK